MNDKNELLKKVDEYIIKTVVLLETMTDAKLKEPVLKQLETILKVRARTVEQLKDEENGK